jgi:tripartite-type tricarboxylate transporter receptor subunit TctC
VNFKIRSPLAACIASLAGIASVPAHAQDYPSRPVEVVVGWSAGGIIDATARGFAKSMSEVSGGRFVVMNREGASGMIAAQLVAQANTDGYTIGFGPITPMATVAYAMQNPRFSANDFQYVCKVFDNVFTVMVPNNSPYKTIQSLVADMRAKPGKLAYGHFGSNSLGHMVGAKLADTLQLQVVEVPFKGEAPIYPELMANRLDFGIGTLNGGRGKPVRILGVVSEQRVASLPDVPTLKEAGLPTLAPAQVGLFVPKNLPKATTDKLAELCDKTVHSASFKDHMQRLQEPIVYRRQPEFTKLAHESFEAQIEQAKKMGVKPQ